MNPAYLLLLLALSVKNDGTALRTSCSADSDTVATVPGGAAVKIKFSMAGEATPCYKVSVAVGDKTVDGYLSAASIDGLDSFEKERKNANWAATLPPTETSPASANSRKDETMPPLKIEGTKIVKDAQQLIKENRSADALKLLEPELRAHPHPTKNEAGLYATAGIAAWKAGDDRTALEYWRKALDVENDPGLAALYAKVDRDVKNNGTKPMLIGIRVKLLYDDGAVPADEARGMLSIIDETYARVSQELGCTSEDRIVAIVTSRQAYMSATGAPEWSGGLFDGRIHIPASAGKEMNAEDRKALTHETVHACLAMMGRWPTWLHEGLAQTLSGDKLSSNTRTQFAQLAKDGKLPTLEMLSNGFTGMNSQQAQIAYLVSLDAAETMYADFHNDGIRNILRNPARLPAVMEELDKRLGE
jgi:hypothetical protein